MILAWIFGVDYEAMMIRDGIIWLNYKQWVRIEGVFVASP
jgi:hypothetical protein